VKDSLLSKRMSGTIKGYGFVCATVFILGWWRMMAEDCSPRAIGIIFAAMGALFTYLFFGSVGRLDVYKHDAQVQKKDKNPKD